MDICSQDLQDCAVSDARITVGPCKYLLDKMFTLATWTGRQVNGCRHVRWLLRRIATCNRLGLKQHLLDALQHFFARRPVVL